MNSGETVSAAGDPDGTHRSAGGSGGSWSVSSGTQAVNAAARVVCEGNAVDSAGVAEGLARSGRRAATLLGIDPGSLPTGAAPWVFHRVGSVGRAPSWPHGFELIAADAQQAVDHVLVAQRLARRTGAPGTCTVAPEIATGLHYVRLPDRDAPEWLDGAAPVEPIACSYELVCESFADIARFTGRPLVPLLLDGTKTAELILVAIGDDIPRAIELARACRARGIACGVVGVSVLHPFPFRPVRSALEHAAAIATIGRVDADDDGAGLDALFRAAQLADASRSCSVRWGEDGALQVPETLRRRFDLRQASSAEPTPGRRVVIGACPRGSWGERLLLEGAALLGPLRDRPVPRWIPTAGPNALELSNGPPGRPAPRGIDVLVCADPVALERGVVDAMQPGGTILFDAAGDALEASWLALDPALRRTLGQRNLRLAWTGRATDGHGAGSSRRRLQGALFAGCGIAERLGLDAEAILRGAAEPVADELRQGVASLRMLDPRSLESELGGRQVGGGHALESRARHVTEAPGAAGWRETLREFHLGQAGADRLGEPHSALPLEPCVLDGLARSEPKWRHYPLIVPRDHATAAHPLVAAIEAVPQLAIEPCRWVEAANRCIEGRSTPIAFEELLERMNDELRRTDGADPQAIDADLEVLRRTLPHDAIAFGLSRALPLMLYLDEIRRERGPRRRAFGELVEREVAQLGDLLRLDDAHGPQARNATALSAALGGAAGLLDAEVLAANLPVRPGTQGLEPSRRKRIEQAVEALRAFQARAAAAPELIVVKPPGLALPELPGAWVIEHANGLELASGLCIGQAQAWTPVHRALRLARFEAEDDVDPARVEQRLGRFDWQAFNASERRLLPPVLVLERAAEIRGAAGERLSRLLRSGLPIHVIVVAAPGEAPQEPEDRSAPLADPASLVLEHRDAVVVQSSLGDPAQMIRGIARVAATLRPGLALISVPRENEPRAAWAELQAVRVSRTRPCFVYDPDAGSDWADRLDLEGNPQPERRWPRFDAGSETEALTLAHAAALDADNRHRFRVLPQEAWSDEQLAIEDYLDEEETLQRRTIPFIRVDLGDAGPARAALTRELASACRDRMLAWQTLKELAFSGRAHVRRASGAARQEALEASSEVEHARSLARVRAQTARTTVERLVLALAGGDPAGMLAEIAAHRAPIPPAAAESLPDVREPVRSVAPPAGKPYIDSVLCTTCQDCIKINPRMFKYNDDKQAFIADPTAGSFKQLVMAAEKCPARCIHPGAPRTGDTTASAKLIARAEPFN